MTSDSPQANSAAETEGDRSRFAGFVRRRPISAYLIGALGIGLPLLIVPGIAGIPMAPFLLPMTYVALLGSALVVTRLASGPGAVRHLLSRLLIWRFGVARWVVIVLAVPVLTVALAGASGTLKSPAEGLGSVVGGYLFATFIFGALLINLWEETAWGGFLQSRLMGHRGLLVGSLLTALPFALLHVPLSFDGDWTWSNVGISLALLFGLAPFYRYLLGMHLLDTSGSLLAVGVQHASWNAAGNLGVFSGEWQPSAAVVLLTVLLAVGRRFAQRERLPTGREAEKAAAAEWTGGATAKALVQAGGRS